MRSLALVLIALSATLPLAGCTPEPPPRAKVAIVGIDGAAWQNLQPLIDRGVLPNLAKIEREGVWGPLTVDSAQSPESWTSLATGHHPEQHGIIQTPGVEGSTFMAGAEQLKVKRLWDMAGERGRKVMVANYWITRRAYPVNGVLIARESDEVYPSGTLTQRPNFVADHQRERIRELSLEAAKSGWMRAALDEVPDFDLVILPIYAYDQALHMLWDEWEAGEQLAGSAPPPELLALPEAQLQSVRDGHVVVEETAKMADTLVGWALDYVGDDGYVMIVSDHGHRAAEPSMRRVALPRSLFDGRPGTVEEGRFKVDGATVVVGSSERRIQGATPALSYVLRSPHLSFEGDDSGAIRARFEALLTEEGEPVFVAEGGALRLGPAVLAAVPTALGKLETEQFTVFVNSGAHGIEDKGVFGLRGPGVAPGPLAQEVSSIDVTPTALWLMGLPVPEDVAGAPATLALTEPARAAKGLQTIPSYEDGTRPWATPQTPGITSEELERLKALGYITGAGPEPIPGPGGPSQSSSQSPSQQGPANPPPKRAPPR